MTSSLIATATFMESKTSKLEVVLFFSLFLFLFFFSFSHVCSVCVEIFPFFLFSFPPNPLR